MGIKRIVKTAVVVFMAAAVLCGCSDGGQNVGQIANTTETETMTVTATSTPTITTTKATTAKKSIKEKSYSELTNSDKKEICKYIQSRYDHYDEIEGGYSGDTYSDTIWSEAAQKYDLTEDEISIIWMKAYEYN